MLSEEQARRSFPCRLLRYLVAYNYLLEARHRLGRPLVVCEIGIDRGQMLTYTKAATEFQGSALSELVRQWHGVDIDINRCLEPAYSSLIKVNIEHRIPDVDADVYFLVHLLEHLYEPEATLGRLSNASPSHASFIVGVPCHPPLLDLLRERAIRRAPNWNGHVSAFSRRRLLRSLRMAGLRAEREDGAYLLRASGFRIEDFCWWHGWNLWFGRIFPGWPGEYYCLARKPSGR